jgi:hypothetical protein
VSEDVSRPPQSALAGLEQQLGDAVSTSLSSGLALIREQVNADIVQAVQEITLSIQLLLVRLQGELATAADEHSPYDPDTAPATRNDVLALNRRFDELRELLLG